MGEHRLPWTTIVVLSLLALVRPLYDLTGDPEDWGGAGGAPLEVFAAISLLWIVTGVLAARPVETLAAAGLTYAALSAVLVTGLSPAITGRLQGPLVDPLALISSLAGNVVWGILCGLAAQGIVTLRRSGARRWARRHGGGGHDGPPPDGPGPAGDGDQPPTSP